jgi:hypothetical protein
MAHTLSKKLITVNDFHVEHILWLLLILKDPLFTLHFFL